MDPKVAETVLRLDSVTKRFGDLVANDAVSFDLKRGEVIALLGENGAGKTTLMNILFGHYVADEGSIMAFGRPLPPGDPAAAIAAGIGMVHQHFTLAEQLTVVDNIALGTEPLFSPRYNRRKARERIRRIAGEFGLDVNPDAEVSKLAVGERQRVEILKALYRDVKILILDEPTAVLTPLETEALFSTLRKLVAAGLSIIFISHKLAEVMAISDRVLVLRAGRLAGERPTAETTRHELAVLMVGEDVSEAPVREARPGAIRLQLAGVDVEPAEGNGVRHADLELRAGEITGLAGVSGNGQAVLAALLEGTLAPARGEFRIDGKPVGDWTPRTALANRLGRIPEDRHATGMIADMSVSENVVSEAYRSRRFSRFGFLDFAAARRFAETIIAAYDIKCPSPDARVRLLSGGNMQKLILGRALDGDPAIIVANQPTRGLDVGAVAYVHARLVEARDRGTAILLISEDLDEVIALSDRIIVMSRGRLSPPSARGERSVRQLGELMAGHGFGEDAADAA
jgi:simple sugar transport system ATP-binding protein